MRMFSKKTAKVRDRAREVADELRKDADKVDAQCTFPASHLGLLWDSGFMALRAPREQGGMDATLPEAAVVVEELARGSAAAALIVLLQALAAEAIRGFASEKQAAEWFDKIVTNRFISSFALSEPEPGPSEKAKLTVARKVKGGYVITGRKTFVTGARDADLVVVFAVTSPKARLKKALSAFVIPAGTTGMMPGAEDPKSGLRGAPAVELVFSGCRVAASTRLGAAGAGYAVAQKAIITAAPLAAALSCGLLAEALEHTIALARGRGRNAAPLSEFQPLELALADAMAGLDSSLALTWAAAGAVEENAPGAERLARESKWVAGEAAVSGIDQAMAMFGLEASLRGSYLERLSRDARSARLILGPNHIHKIEVARKLISGKY
ncbi:MAG TPA: acyl-CoA dehydrogenase family protein [bacterium]|nr:acyl-CoA dehydrogenase family protein [bacterium]